MLTRRFNILSLFIFVLLSLIIFQTRAFALQMQEGTNFDIASLFTTIGALTGGVLFLTGIVKKLLKTKDNQTLVVSGVLGLILSGIGYWLQAGIFALLEWWYIPIYAVIAMALANELTTWPLIKGLLILFRLKVPKNT